MVSLAVDTVFCHIQAKYNLHRNPWWCSYSRFLEYYRNQRILSSYYSNIIIYVLCTLFLVCQLVKIDQMKQYILKVNLTFKNGSFGQNSVYFLIIFLQKNLFKIYFVKSMLPKIEFSFRKKLCTFIWLIDSFLYFHISHSPHP